MYVIAGVSGNTGSAVATTLLADQQPVRVIVRDAAKGEPWKARGAEVAVAALENRAALATALTGAKGAYLLQPPPVHTATEIPAERARLNAAIIGAVRDARPDHVVLLSSMGAELPSGNGLLQYLHTLEAGLRESGVPSTFLRAGFFMENWVGMAQAVIATGTLSYGIQIDLRLPQVATPDIGRIAARLLVEDATTRIVKLAGPVDLSVQEVAAILGTIAGKPITAVMVPPHALSESMRSMGASPEFAAMYAEVMVTSNIVLKTWEGTDCVRGTITLEQRLRELLAK